MDFGGGDGGRAADGLDGRVREFDEGELDIAGGIVGGDATAGDLDVEAGPGVYAGDGRDGGGAQGFDTSGGQGGGEELAVAAGF